MRRLMIAFLFLAVCSGCSAAPESSPLAIVSRLDSAQVTVWPATGGVPLASTVVRDSESLAELRAIASEPGDWHPITMATTPSGDVRAALYRGTVYVGVVSAGRDWIGARDAAGNERFRTMTTADSLRVAQLRAAK